MADLLAWEESERARRSLERRLRIAKIGRFKPLCDFDWTGPAQCDQGAIADLMGLDFVKGMYAGTAEIPSRPVPWARALRAADPADPRSRWR